MLPKHAKCLGCELDRSLSGEIMGQIVITKVNEKITFCARKAQYLDKETLEMLASLLIQPHYDHTGTTWCSSTPKGIKT